MNQLLPVRLAITCKQRSSVAGRFLFLFLLVGLSSHDSFAQKIFRRHFIIAYDISPPFINAERHTPAFSDALTALFLNKQPSGYADADRENLMTEKNNGLPFFDESKDEISFYHFNVSVGEMQDLRTTAYLRQSGSLLKNFNNDFIKDKGLRWSSFSKDQKKGSLNAFISTALNEPPAIPYFGGGVSMSDFVFPLVLNQVDTTQYAQEYILVVLSDFLTGSDLGNKNDIERVRDIFQVPYDITLPSTSPVSIIKQQIDQLSAQFYKIDYFQYVFKPSYHHNAIAMIGYKIKPKAGKLNPEDLSVFIDGDLRLDQKSYLGTDFKVNATTIKFTHNPFLTPDRLRLTILAEGARGATTLFADTIATRDKSGAWSSAYSDDSGLLRYDTARSNYFLPALHLQLDNSINDKGFSGLKFIYAFDTHYQAAGSLPLNLIYTAERDIDTGQINYATKLTTIMIFIVAPLVLIILLIWYMVNYGKPLNVFVEIDEFLDSFEKTDYATVGKLHTPYLAWTGAFTTELVPVNGVIGYTSASYPFNWKPVVRVCLMEYTIADGFELFITTKSKSAKEFGQGIPMPLKGNATEKLQFAIGIRQARVTLSLKQPELVKLKLLISWDEKKGPVRSSQSLMINYSFYVGPDLKDVWVAFDPGTSGSCSAAGSATENITLGRDKDKNPIIDSKIIFEIEEDLPEDGQITEKLAKYGTAAKTKFGTPRVKSFQSIKKLLGYKDLSEITFKNGKSLHLSGKQLASLLVKGLFGDLKLTLLNPGIQKDEYYRDGVFDPKRAVVAIPNNFTLSKIQDIVDCVLQTGQFLEIRYVYEAEAILFYYLSNFSRLNKGESPPQSEQLLVFDMGGATINTSVMRSEKIMVNKLPVYQIDYLSKIGYGIGGDTIDYCIISILKEGSAEYPELAAINPLLNSKLLSELAYNIKKEIIENYNRQGNNLILTSDLERYLKRYANVTIDISAETSKLYSYFKKDANGIYPLFHHPLFLRIIYNSVADAVKEAIDLSGKPAIQKVIFSGRSTAFPLVKDAVIKALAKIGDKPKLIALDLEESKTAVALGACWYGINKSAVILNNLKANASFGIKKTLSADKDDIKYYELVKPGTPFSHNNDEAGALMGTEKIVDNFAFDGGKVNYYQVMGKNVNEILTKNQRHKYSRIAQIQLPQLTAEVAVEVSENDEVECIVELQSGRLIKTKGAVSDQDIDDDNDEHYTWILK